MIPAPLEINNPIVFIALPFAIELISGGLFSSNDSFLSDLLRKCEKIQLNRLITIFALNINYCITTIIKVPSWDLCSTFRQNNHSVETRFNICKVEFSI